MIICDDDDDYDMKVDYWWRNMLFDVKRVVHVQMDMSK